MKYTSVCLIVLLLSLVPATGFYAQGEPVPSETPTTTPTPSETPTASLTSTYTETATETPTASLTATLTETLTETLTATLTETPTETPTAVLLNTAEAPTAQGETPIPSATLIQTETPLPPIPNLSLLIQDGFEQDLSLWSLSSGVALMPNLDRGTALVISNTPSAAQLNLGSYYTVSVQASFRILQGTARLSVRGSTAGQYTASIGLDGKVELYRGDVLLQSTSFNLNQGWHTVQLSAIDKQIQVNVDGNEIFSFFDDAPLPPGTIFISGDATDQSTLFVDDVNVWVSDKEMPEQLVLAPEVNPITPVVVSKFSLSIQSMSSTIAYYLCNPACDIYVVDPTDPGVSYNLTDTFNNDAFNPVISPNGRKIIFEANGGLYIIDADNNYNITQLTSSGANASWSPNGSKIAFNRFSPTEIYTMNADGTGITQVTFNTLEDYAPTWSPDGTKLAFNSYRNANFDIYVKTLPNGVETALVSNPAIDSSPDWSSSNKLAFTSTRAGNTEIYVKTISSGVEERITNSASAEGVPDWSPDNALLTYDLSQQINTINVTSKSVSNITAGNRPTWSSAFPLPTPTPSPTFTPSPLPPVCYAYVVITTGESTVNMRNLPSQSGTILMAVPNESQVAVIGRTSGWFYVEYFGVRGWITAGVLPMAQSQYCPGVPPVNNDGTLVVAIYDFDLEIPSGGWSAWSNAYVNCYADPSQANPPLTLEENNRNCSRVVYREYFITFVDTFQRNPRMSDILGVVFYNELGVAYSSPIPSENPPTTTAENARIALSNNYWLVVYDALTTSYCPGSLDLPAYEMTPDQITGCYLVQVESWYNKANAGSPDPDDIYNLVSQDTYLPIAMETLQSNIYYGCDGSHPCHWGNYGYDDPQDDYAAILSTRPFKFCYRYRDFLEGDGDPNTAFHTFTVGVPTDTWDDYIFILVASNTGRSTSRYSYLENPSWLTALEPDGITWTRSHIRKIFDACPSS